MIQTRPVEAEIMGPASTETGMSIPSFYTPEEIAELLKVSRRSVYEWLSAGKLHGLRAGQYWRITEEDLMKFMQRRERDHGGSGRRVTGGGR